MTQKEIENKIKEANKAYRSGESIMTDDEYDVLVDQLELMDPENELLKDTGSEEALDESRKITLPYPMKSFQKVYNDDVKGDQLTPWLKTHAGTVKSAKYDGAALLVQYEGGRLVRAITKGRNDIGQLATAHANMIPGIPKRIGDHGNVNVKLELVIAKSIFEKKYSHYKNPRNLVAGLLNSKKPDERLRDVTAFAHTIIKPNHRFDKEEEFKLLNRLGFLTVLWKKTTEYNTSEELETLLKEYKEGDYLVDGVIIELNNKVTRNLAGLHPNGNPKYAVAYKENDWANVKETTVTGIDWKVSKFGNVVPTVEYEPVTLLDTECHRVSGKHADYIFKNKIDVGAKIKIIKGGDIIPDIVSTLKISDKYKEKIEKPLDKCPSCGHSLEWDTNHVHLICNNIECDGQLTKTILSFIKKLNVKNIDLTLLRKIIEATNIKTIDDLLRLNPEDMITDGIGEKTANKFTSDLKEALTDVDLATLMHATGLFPPTVGSTKIQWVINVCGDLTKNIPDKDTILEIKGFSDKTADFFLEGANAFKDWYEKNKELITYTYHNTAEIEETVDTTGEYYDKNIVFTGFRDKDLEEYFINQGANIKKTVSKNTDLVIAKDKEENSSKLKKAKELKINIKEVNEFNKKQ
jgi:DNA ligase (NAD+)